MEISFDDLVVGGVYKVEMYPKFQGALIAIVVSRCVYRGKRNTSFEALDILYGSFWQSNEKWHIFSIDLEHRRFVFTKIPNNEVYKI